MSLMRCKQIKKLTDYGCHKSHPNDRWIYICRGNGGISFNRTSAFPTLWVIFVGDLRDICGVSLNVKVTG